MDPTDDDAMTLDELFGGGDDGEGGPPAAGPVLPPASADRI